MPTNKTYQDVQLFIDFSKDITGATKLADSVLYANLESSGQQTNSNLAISLAKIYTWANDVFTFNPSATGTTPKITINSAVLPVDSDTTYSFREGTTKGCFQVQEDDEAWQTIGVYQVGTDLGHGDGLTATEPPDKIYLIDRAGTKISNTTIGLLDPVLSGQTVVGWKIKESLLPSYVDDVIEAYYDNGDFYSDPTTHTSTTKITPESGKIYVDITTNSSYRWGGSTYIKISNPVDVMVGASASANGVAGLVPAPLIGDQTKFLRGDATWVTIATTDTTYILSGITYNSDNTKQVVTLTPSVGTDDSYATIEPMVGATSSAAGKAGLVPKPATGNRSQYLRGDGSWATPTNTTYTLSGTTYNSDNTAQIVTLTPSSGSATTSTISEMVGADGTNAGKAGLVPKPVATDNTKYLNGAGEWAVPTNTTYGLSGAYGSNNDTWVTTLTAGGSGTTSTVPKATTSVYGITKLSSSTSSTSEALAATPKAVKAAYDLANGKSTVTYTQSVSSGTLLGTLSINGSTTNNGIYAPNFSAASSSAAGTRGLVQAPANSMDKYLRGDATWVDPVEDFRTKVNDETFTLVLHCTNGRTSS